MCRKFTGCILPQNVAILTAYIDPPLPGNETYKTYQSSPGAYRTFCSNCGSSLTFNEKEKPEITEIHLGSLDEEVLCGTKIGGEGDGKVKRDASGFGLDLCKARNHVWMENAIVGLTDKLEGELYPKGTTTVNHEKHC
jgi:hypothetical protein